MTLNVDKMRKQLYRRVPDRLEFAVDPLEDGTEYKIRKTIADFTQRMEGKHGKNLRGIMSYTNSSQFDGKSYVTVVATLNNYPRRR